MASDGFGWLRMAPDGSGWLLTAPDCSRLLLSRASSSAHQAVAGSTSHPWSAEEDATLLQLMAKHGLHRWPAVADAVAALGASQHSIPRTSTTCKRRWDRRSSDD